MRGKLKYSYKTKFLSINMIEHVQIHVDTDSATLTARTDRAASKHADRRHHTTQPYKASLQPKRCSYDRGSSASAACYIATCATSSRLHVVRRAVIVAGLP